MNFCRWFCESKMKEPQIWQSSFGPKRNVCQFLLLIGWLEEPLARGNRYLTRASGELVSGMENSISNNGGHTQWKCWSRWLPWVYVCVYTNMLFTYLRILQCHYPFPINPSVHINREMLDMVLQQNWSEWWSSCCSDPFWVGLQFPMLGWPLTILNCNERKETMRMIWACTSFCNL